MRQRITDKQGICLIVLFIIGSSVIIGTGGGAENDAWISGILGLLLSLPVIFIYARILSLFPGRDLFSVLEIVFGRVFGKILSIFYTFYSFHLGALVLRNFGEFIKFATFNEAPLLAPIILLALLSILASLFGVEVLARGAAYMLPFQLILLVFFVILSASEGDPDMLKPILGNGLSPVIKSGFSAFSFPFAETILFMSVLTVMTSRKSCFKVYYWGILIGGSVIVIITLMNIILLGPMGGSLFFPTYMAISRLSIGPFFNRFEIIVSLLYTLSTSIKATVCLISFSKGISTILKLKSYRLAVIPSGIMLCALAEAVYTNTGQMQFFAKNIYHWYAFPFQVILPLLILISAQIRIRRGLKV